MGLLEDAGSFGRAMATCIRVSGRMSPGYGEKPYADD